jgi:DNA-binding MarR family transcriptional regulator
MAKKQTKKSKILKVSPELPKSDETQDPPLDKAIIELADQFGGAGDVKIKFFTTILRLSTEINVRQESFYGQFNLTPARFQILLFLRVSAGFALSPSDLADKIGVSRATMTQFLDALEKTGFVQRKAFPGDRRSMLIELSKDGLELLDKKLLPKYFKRCRLSSDRTTMAEMKQFVDIYRQICAKIAASDCE